MRILVVIFTLLGMLGTGFFGYVMTEALDETNQSGSVNIKEMNQMIDTTIASLESGEMPAPNKDEAIAGFKSAKGAFQSANYLPGTFYGAAGVGLLLMLLSVLKIGPKVVHGVGLIAAGLAPFGLTSYVLGALRKFQDFMMKLDPNSKQMISPEDLANGQLIILACCAGLLLAGISAFFVKRD